MKITKIINGGFLINGTEVLNLGKTGSGGGQLIRDGRVRDNSNVTSRRNTGKQSISNYLFVTIINYLLTAQVNL